MTTPFAHLSPAAIDLLGALFIQGPTNDTAAPAAPRQELIAMGFAVRHHGWTWLTPPGIELATAPESVQDAQMQGRMAWHQKATGAGP